MVNQLTLITYIQSYMEKDIQSDYTRYTFCLVYKYTICWGYNWGIIYGHRYGMIWNDLAI